MGSILIEVSLSLQVSAFLIRSRICSLSPAAVGAGFWAVSAGDAVAWDVSAPAFYPFSLFPVQPDKLMAKIMVPSFKYFIFYMLKCFCGIKAR
jgi:hypothetical protein